MGVRLLPGAPIPGGGGRAHLHGCKNSKCILIGGEADLVRSYLGVIPELSCFLYILTFHI